MQLCRFIANQLSHTPWSAHRQHALPYSVHTTASFPIQVSTTINIMHNNRVPERPQDILVNFNAGGKSLAVNDALSKLWSHCHSFKLARNVFSRWNSQTGKKRLLQVELSNWQERLSSGGTLKLARSFPQAELTVASTKKYRNVSRDLDFETQL